MTTTPNTPHMTQVRQALLATLADLRDRENPMDIDRAKAVATVASVLVDTARVEVDYLKLTGNDRSQFMGVRPDQAGANGDLTMLPGDRNGISSIVQHKLRG